MNIRSLVSKVHTSAESVLTNALRISESSERSYEASNQIAVAVQEVAKGSSQQSVDILRIT